MYINVKIQMHVVELKWWFKMSDQSNQSITTHMLKRHHILLVIKLWICQSMNVFSGQDSIRHYEF